MGDSVSYGIKMCNSYGYSYKDYYWPYRTEEKEVAKLEPITVDLALSTNLDKKDISTEQWREYDFGGRVYRIDSPVTLYTRVGGTTHRVVDSEGVVHCVPAPGEKGCVLRWLNKDKKVPVNF